MADVNANIGVHIDTSGALAELKALQRQLANFHSSVSKSSAAAAMAQKGLQTNLLNSINATGKFRAQMGLVRTSTESFTHALETNKLSMREYFRYAGGSTRTFGKLFKQEFNTIGRVAEERVKKMQTQYIKMGRDASGAMKAISITPNTLNMKDYSTKLAVAAQKQALLNQLLKQGSTNLLNFGKNTQWAGRQLMVGFTIPLAYFGTAAAKTFMDLEKQAIRFKRVYGDMFTTTDETNKALADVEQLAKEFTKYGVAVTETMQMAADAAAMGKTGADLTAQVAQATRLAVLGGVEQQQALETTISVTNAFGVAAEELAGKINFLNAVENQTVVSIEDLTEAIPKAGPVVKQLGGSVEDLAFFLTAMKEGGINASEGANALKSGLASLINPSDKAAAFLGKLGVNINAIVETNKGNIRNTVIDFSRALDTLDPLNRARAIEQLFGKFQFSRLSTLFQNVTKEGTQAARVLDLAGASIEELAILSERELGVLENAVGVNFKESIEKLKVSIAPIGKTFLEAVTPIVQVVGRLLDKFSNLGEGTKKFIVIASTLVGVIGPVLLMTFGLLANGVANIIKLFITMRSGFLRAGTNTNLLAQQTSYLNSEQLEAATVAASLNQAHTRLTQSFAVETTAVRMLRQAYIDATIAATNFARTNPGMMMPGGKFTPKKFASGVTEVPGTGNKDTVPAMLTPGEAVIPKGISQDPRFRPIIDAMVNGKLQGFGAGSTGVTPVNVPSRFNPEDKIFNAKTASGAKNIQEFLASLKKNPDGTYSYTDPKGKYNKSNIPVSKIASVLNERSSAGSFSLSQIQEKLGIGSTGLRASTKKSGVTSRPQFIADAMNKLPNKGITGLDSEIQAIKKRFAENGLNISDRKQSRLFQVDASHIRPEIGPDGKKVWKVSNIVPDTGYVNNFISNSLKGKLGKTLDKMSREELKLLGIDKNAFRSMYAGGDPSKGSHPVTAKQAETLQSIARYVTQPGTVQRLGLTKNALYQAHALDAGLGARFGTGFYKGGLRTLGKLQVAMAPGEGLVDNKGRASQVTVGTGKRKAKDTIQLGGNKQDTRVLPASKVMKVIPRPGFKGPGSFAIGASGGFDANGNPISTKPGMAISKVQEDFKAQQNSLRRQIQKLEKERISSLRKEINTLKEGAKLNENKTTLTAKEQKRELRAQRAAAVGKVAGPVAGIAGIGAMAGFMTGNNSMGMAMMGISALATIAPMLTNPLGILVGVLATASAGFLLYTKMLKNAREEGMNLAKAMSMSASRVKGLSVLSGQISASEIQAKKRQTTLNPLGEPQRKFGQNVLQSEEGKNILSDVERLVKQNFSTQQIGKILGTNLSQAVLQGAISTDQARSIASALGEQIGSYDIPLSVSAKITELMGPNGENLKNNPLQVALEIKKDSMQNLTEALDVFKAGKKNSLLAGLSRPEKPGGLFSVSSLPFGDAIKQIFNQKKENAKLDAAGVQLGFEAIGQNQQLLDSINEQYDKKIKLAKTEKEVNDLQIKRKSDVDKLNVENNKTLTEVIGISKSLSDDTFNTTVKESLDSRIKDASAATKALNEVASEEVLKVKDKTLRRTLQIGLASENGLSPQAIISLTSFVASSENASKSIDLFIKANGLAQLETLTAIFGKFTGSKTGKDMTPIMREFITKYINENSVELKDDLAALSALGNFREQYNVTLDVNSNGVLDLQQATNALGLIKNFPDKINKNFLATVNDPDGNFTQFAKDFDVLSQGKSEVSKYLYVNYILGLNDPNLVAAAKAAKMTVPEYIAKGFNEALAKPAVATPPSSSSGARNTTFDDILKKLKLTRDATINAQGGAKELMRILGGAKDLKAFNGINQQLSKLGANSDFLDFVGGLENAVKEGIITIKKGIVSYGKYGEAAKKAFDEASLGAFSAANAQAINESMKQRDAFVKLKAAGLDTASAQELLADKTFMVSLAAQKNSGEIKKMIKEYQNLKNVERGTQEIVDPAQAFKDRLKNELDYYDFLERQAKASVKLEIDRINDLIDANDRLIEAKERTIETDIDRPIQKFNEDLDLIDRSIAKINEKYDAQEKALETISEINSDIADRESSRITIADALTRGDISAAAKAIQERRAEEARKAKENSSRLLQIAREKEISKLTNTDGLTKIQIEEKIYALEQKKLLLVADVVKLQDQNYTLQNVTLRVQEDALNKTLKSIDAARFAYEQQIIAIDKAKFAALGFNGELESGEATLLRMRALWLEINGKAPASSPVVVPTKDPSTDDPFAADKAKLAALDKSIKDLLDKVKTTNKIPDTPTPSAYSQGKSGGLYGPTPPVVQKTSTGIPIYIAKPVQTPYNPLSAFSAPPKPTVSYRARAMGGIIPKYYVSGGYSKGTDTIPAMLTPGEFVVRKNAVDSFGVNNLNKINDGSYGGSSVYNYSLNVNVKSDSSPDDIARTVMTQIRRIDNQRIKGQK